MAFVVIFFAALSVQAQYIDGPDRYFYEEDFDWRWDVRVRISDGIRTGYLTNREANRLYRNLERIERKEWAFQSDGYYSPWEQDEIWRDVVNLNHLLGLELSDWDRRYYGYTGVVITGPLHWYFGPSYDFYRFDKRGYGSIRVGYVPRNYYPVKHVYYTKRNNYTTHWNTRPARVATPARSSNSSRGYSERSVQSSRQAAPDRASQRTSRANERTSPANTRTEPARSSTSGRTSSDRSSSVTPSPQSNRPAATSSRPARGTEARSGSSSTSTPAKSKSTVQSRSSSRSSGVTPSSRSARSESKSSSSRSSRSRD